MPAQEPQLLVCVPASAQHTWAGEAQTPSLHQEVSALLPAVPHAQQVGWHCVGSVQALPGAPSLQVATVVAPEHSSFTLTLAIESASVTITGDEVQLDTALPSLEQAARNPVNAAHHAPCSRRLPPNMLRSDSIAPPPSTASTDWRALMRHRGRTRPGQ
jgi:hypothetical protein